MLSNRYRLRYVMYTRGPRVLYPFLPLCIVRHCTLLAEITVTEIYLFICL